MLLKGIREENGWMFADYQATWRYGYDFMLDVGQVVIDKDFKENLQRVAIAELAEAGQEECMDAVRAAGNELRKADKVARENGVLIVSGLSSIMECPVQIMLYNQTSVIRLCTPLKKVFEEGGDNAFTTYLSSIEIKAYCTDTERRCKAGGTNA